MSGSMIFPKHDGGLTLTRIEHKTYYMSLSRYFEDSLDMCDITQEDKAEALRTDSFWRLQWYPDTPVGFRAVGAPTLERLLERVAPQPSIAGHDGKLSEIERKEPTEVQS